MSFKVMSKEAFPRWVESLLVDYQVIAPQVKGDGFVFAEVRSPAEVVMDYPTTLLPPKKAVLPPCETLIEFDKQNGRTQASFDDTPTLLLGIHTCDLHALALLDRAFGQGYPDQHYITRRENLTLASVECLEPCSEHSFCKDMGTLTVPETFDVHLTDLGEDYSVEVSSEKGAKLLDGFDKLHNATNGEIRRAGKAMSEKWSRFPLRLDADVSELRNLLSISYRSVLWDELGEQCLGCGACTILCPTCYCFDVQDEIDFSLSAGTRQRVWDSCQLDQFASVAGGHDFRSTRAARQRHRFFRKYRNQTVASGLAGCVGCGRCAQACLAGITPIKVLNKLYGRRVASTHNHREALLWQS